MPKKLDECVKALKEKGHSESSAFAICQSNDNASDSIVFDYKSIDNDFTIR